MMTFIIFQIIVFSAVIYFLKRILYGDTETAVKRLSLVYEDLLKKQKDLTEKIEAAEKDYQAKKDEAAAIAEKLSNQAMDEVRKKEDEILKKARAEAEDIVAKAQSSREQIRREIEIDVSKKTVDFSVELLMNVFDKEIFRELHGHLVKNFLENAKNAEFAATDTQGKVPTMEMAFPLKPEEKELLNKTLTEKMGLANVKVEETVNEKLIAGPIFRVGTLVLDGSFVTLIREAADKLKQKLQG